MSGRILDIGSGAAGFLATLDVGWRKFAVEPMSTHALPSGTTVLQGFLEEVELDPARFTVVSAFDVFEHFSDPNAAVKQLASTLRPGGILLIETGAIDAAVPRMFGGAWYYVHFLEHLQVFGTRSMTLLLQRHGLAVQEVRRVRHGATTSGRTRALAASLGYIATTLGGRTTGLWRMLANRARESRSWAAPNTIPVSRDHIFVVARRP
jgi:SAM-dependent methyltransferase